MEVKVDEPNSESDTQLLSHTAATASSKCGDGIESQSHQQDAVAGSATDAMDLDLEFVCCLLQPPISHQDSDYVAMRRVLLLRKGQSNPSAISHRKVLLLPSLILSFSYLIY